MRRVNIILALVVVAVLGFSARAGVPSLINYQGRLTDNAGNPLDVTVSIKFTIYDDSTGATTKWSETQPSVVVANGLFNVLLGSVNPISDTVFVGPNRFLGIKIGVNTEMTPRTRLVASAYSLRAHAVTGFNPGENNIDSGVYSFIAGDSNKIVGYLCTVAGGSGNTAMGEYSAVGGGHGNIAGSNLPPADSGFVGSSGDFGRRPDQLGYNAWVGGGVGNKALGGFSAVGAGENNQAGWTLVNNLNTCGAWSSVLGGNGNKALGTGAHVGGGDYNTAGFAST
jgi:hypothetical protein